VPPGVECIYNGETNGISARLEVVLSLGAIQMPKVLMQSDIGDRAELQRLGIPLVQHLSGVGPRAYSQGGRLPSATMIIHSILRGPATHIRHLHVIGGRFI
jgi:hypothetical protein